jgi:hypothetical protein
MWIDVLGEFSVHAPAEFRFAVRCPGYPPAGLVPFSHLSAIAISEPKFLSDFPDFADRYARARTVLRFLLLVLPWGRGACRIGGYTPGANGGNGSLRGESQDQPARQTDTLSGVTDLEGSHAELRAGPWSWPAFQTASRTWQGELRMIRFDYGATQLRFSNTLRDVNAEPLKLNPRAPTP